jgi:glycosyltransferase involved in cell wall biosynthesis
MGAERRLVVLASHPIQYQAPLFRALAADPRVDLQVLFLSRHGVEERQDPAFGIPFRWDVDLLSGYPSMFVPNIRERAAPGMVWSYVNPSVVRDLRSLDPDVVLFLGVRSPTGIAALQWAIRRRVRRIYRAESSVLVSRSSVARLAARTVLTKMSAFASIGTANDLYYDALGIEESRRHFAPYTVDNTFFRTRAVKKAAARDQLGLDGPDVVVLYSGKLVPRKDPGAVVAAAALMPERVHILIAGDGELRTDVERQATHLGVRLTLLGFLNQTEIPIAYSAADAVVVPSLVEPWGLVVNEAMCFGLPVIASSRVGARLDLVFSGVNGAVFKAGDPQALAASMRPIVQSAELRDKFGKASADRIRRWDIGDTVSGIVDASLADDD